MSKTRLPSWRDETAKRPLSLRGKAALRLLRSEKNYTLQEIADRVGLSKARVHQIKEKYL